MSPAGLRSLLNQSNFMFILLVVMSLFQVIANPVNSDGNVQLTPYTTRYSQLAKELASFNGEEKKQVSVLIKQAEFYILFRRIDELSGVIDKFEGIAESSMTSLQQAKILNFKGYREYFSGHSSQADDYLTEAISIISEGKMEHDSTEFLLQLQLLSGLNKAFLQQYDVAISSIVETYAFAESIDLRSLLAKGLSYLGDVQYALKHYEAALDYYKQAKPLYPVIDVVDIAFNDMAIAQMVNIVGDKLDALAKLDKVISQFTQQQNLVGLADAYLLKSYFIDKSAPKEALNWIVESVKIREKLGVDIDIANAYVHYSALLFKNNMLEESVKYSKLAVDLVEPLEDYSAKWDAYNIYAKMLNANQQYSLAYEYMSKSERALLAKARLDTTSEAARLSVKFNLKQQALENAFTQREKANLEERNELLQSKLKLQVDMQKNQTWMLISMSTALVVFLVLFIVIYRLYYKNKLLASKDGLTGLNNRRAIMQHAEQEYVNSQRYGFELSVIMLDLDRFKSINDLHGHAVGDLVLKSVASLIKRVQRKTDYVGRIGGEEFLFILPHTSLHEAMNFAERLRYNIKMQLPEFKLAVQDVTVSLGVAACPMGEVQSIASIHDVIQQADQALYRAKEKGRDQVQSNDQPIAQANAAGLVID